MCRFAISRWNTYATAPNTASAAMGPIQRQILDGSGSMAALAVMSSGEEGGAWRLYRVSGLYLMR